MEISDVKLQSPYILGYSSPLNDDVMKHVLMKYLYNCLKSTIADDEKKAKEAQEKLKESTLVAI